MVMAPGERRERIIDYVHGRERASVQELSAVLAISQETVRRDLALLDRGGRIRKVHGGAIARSTEREGPLAQRLQSAIAEKRAIAAAAAALFAPGDSLFVDAGTTTLLFAQALVDAATATVITNSVEIGQAIVAGGGRAYLTGGELRADLGEMIGPLAVQQIEGFHAAHAVLTIGALGPAGPMDYDLEEAQIARAMIRQATRVTLLADGSKLGRSALFQLCPLAKVDRLVTDRPPPPPLAAALDEASVAVIVAAADRSQKVDDRSGIDG